MKRILTALLATALISGGCSKKSEQKTGDQFDTGLAHLDKFEFAQADSAFLNLEKTDSTSLKGPYGRGLVMERKLQWYDALNAYLKLADRDPSFYPALEGAARIYRLLGEYPEIVPALAQCAKIMPTEALPRLRLAQADIDAGQFGDAAKALDTAVALGTDQKVAELVRAKMFLLQGQPEPAEQIGGKALAAPGSSPDYFLAAADYLEARGYIDSAIAMSRRSQTEGADNFDSRLCHFQRCLRTGYLTEARGTIDDIRSQDKSGIVTTGLEQFYSWAANDLRLADLAGNTYVNLAGGSFSSAMFDADSRRVIGNHTAAGGELQDVSVLISKVKTAPEFVEYMRFRVALKLAGLTDKVGAISKLELVTSWRGNLREFKLTLTENKYLTGQFDAYNALRDSILQLRGDRSDWLTGLGDVSSNPAIRLYGDAEKYYRKALELSPTYRPAFESYVRMFTGQRQFDKALGLFSQYPFFAAFYPELAIKRAVCLASGNKVDEALSLFEQNFPYLKGDMATFDEFKQSLAQTGAADAVDKTFAILNRVDPDDPDAMIRQAGHYLEAANNQAALDLAEKVAARDTTLTNAEVLKARALYGLGQRQQAIDLFEKVLAKEDGNVEANIAFSRLLASEKIDPKRAGNLARMALVYDHTIRAQMNLCYVYGELGRNDLCRGEALKAIGNFPNEPEPLFYLGLAMSREGSPEARKNLEKAIAMGLRGDNLKTAQDILGKG
jgi:tetratricopeptide (TPR) repeat protein